MSKERKGIILAGGTGSRLFPITNCVSKQLLPVYDKPMIYYPLTTLMFAGIKDILVITTPQDKKLFQNLLSDGSQLGMRICYEVQKNPDGLAQAFLLGEKFLKGESATLILGDNIFHGEGLSKQLVFCMEQSKGASIFAYPVKDPERYGVAEFDKDENVISIEEKPLKPKSKFAITGLYFYDETIVEKASKLKPSKRGELEITDINMMYLNEKKLKVNILGRGSAWLDTGNIDSLHEASAYIRTLEQRQGLKVGCPEEVAWRMNWINDEELLKLAEPLRKSGYGKYLVKLLESF